MNKLMMNEINARYIKRRAHLERLTSATEALSVTERAYTHLDGRIREVENEIDWLGEIYTSARSEMGD